MRLLTADCDSFNSVAVSIMVPVLDSTMRVSKFSIMSGCASPLVASGSWKDWGEESGIPQPQHRHRQGVLRHLQDLGPVVPASVGSQHIGEGNKEPTAFLWRKHTRTNLTSRLVESSRELPGTDAVQCRPMALKSISIAGSEPLLASLMKPSSAKRVNSRWKVRSVTLA